MGYLLAMVVAGLAAWKMKMFEPTKKKSPAAKVEESPLMVEIRKVRASYPSMTDEKILDYFRQRYPELNNDVLVMAVMATRPLPPPSPTKGE